MERLEEDEDDLAGERHPAVFSRISLSLSHFLSCFGCFLKQIWMDGTLEDLCKSVRAHATCICDEWVHLFVTGVGVWVESEGAAVPAGSLCVIGRDCSAQMSAVKVPLE